MKKVMFIIVGMLFAVTVNAASLAVTPSDTNFADDGGVIYNSGSDSVLVDSNGFSGEFTHTFDVTNTGSSTFRLWVNGSASSAANMDSFSVKVDDVEIADYISSAGIYGVGIFSEILLAAGESVKLVVSGVFTGDAAYEVTLATPIPAALFLFAPALLGFFGLRRKAAVAA